MAFSDGKTLHGEWKNNVFTNGRMTLANGSWYSGAFQQGKLFNGTAGYLNHNGVLYHRVCEEGRFLSERELRGRVQQAQKDPISPTQRSK
eukprot:gene22424-25402_t